MSLQTIRDPSIVFSDFAKVSASYIIFTDGTNVYAKNGDTGAIEYIDTDTAKVIQYAVNNVIGNGGGKIFIRRGLYNANSQIWIKSTIGNAVRVIIEGEGGATGIAEESTTRIVFSNLSLINENSSTCIRVGYRYDDSGNEVSNWDNNGVKIEIRDLSIHCSDTRYRGLVIEGSPDRFDLENVGIYNGAYGIVLRGMAEASVGGRITGCNVGGGYRDVNGITGSALQLGDIVQGKVIGNGIANLLIDNTGLLNIGYPPQNTTLTQNDLTSLRPASLRLIHGGRITVVNSHLHIGGWGWGYGLHQWGSNASNTQPITTSSSPYPGGDIEVYGTNFEGVIPINTSGSVANVDNVFIIQETNTGWIFVRESYFYGNSAVRMLFFARRGNFRIENSRVFYPSGSVELATYYSNAKLLADGNGYISNTEMFYSSGVVPAVSGYITYNGESTDAYFSTWTGSRSNPITLPTSGIPLWGNTVYYKLPAGTSVSAGINSYNAHHAWANDSSRLPDFRIEILQATPELIFIGGQMNTSLPGFVLNFYAPSLITTTKDVIIRIGLGSG